MICARCGHQPWQEPCEYCGGAPVLSGRIRVRLDELVSEGTARAYLGMELQQQWPVFARQVVVPAGFTDRDLAMLEQREAEIRGVSHPGLPALLDVVVLNDERDRHLWTVVDRVTGTTFAEELAAGPLHEAVALDHALELLGVLMSLHFAHPPLVHGDLRPSHVMRKQPGNRLVLVDVPLHPKLPTSLGAAAYRAPEGATGPAADLYSLGVVLVAMLSGKDPNTLRDGSGNLRWTDAVSACATTRLLLGGLLSPNPEARPSHDQVRSLLRQARREVPDPPQEAPRRAAPAPATHTRRGERPRPRPRGGPRPAPEDGSAPAPEGSSESTASQEAPPWSAPVPFGVALGLLLLGSTVVFATLLAVVFALSG